ncbi:MAG: hypothetical protein AB3N20_15020 [Rhizobiaceae bacterium]
MKVVRAGSALLAVFAIVSLLFSTALSRAGDNVASGPLDGMVFSGKIGTKGGHRLDDELHFRDGKFWSEYCTRCGLPPGDYWVRNVGDEIHFRGTLVGKPGTFIYEGRIVDGKATASVSWSKERWYWTINRELEFSGSLKLTGQSMSVADALKTASTSSPEQLAQCNR